MKYSILRSFLKALKKLRCSTLAKISQFHHNYNVKNIFRTYIYGNRRYGYYQPNGYGSQYPGQYQPEQFPGNTGLGDDRFKIDPVSIKRVKKIFNYKQLKFFSMN